MQYDFDVEPFARPRKRTDPQMVSLLQELGVREGQGAVFQAKFRDKRAIDALAGASHLIREVFEDCGFSWVASVVDLPPGHVRSQDHHLIDDIVKNLQEKLAECDLHQQSWNGFDLAAFLAAQVNRTPVHDLLGDARTGRGH